MLLELIQKNWHLIKPKDGKQKCTRTVWVQIGAELKKAGYRSKTEDKMCGKECSQKWSNLQKQYKCRRAAEKQTGAPASEYWQFDAPIETLLHKHLRNFSLMVFFLLFQRVTQKLHIHLCFLSGRGQTDG